MACEDWPCCGHEAGCCPDFDESGKQLNMKCVCGATLPVNSRYSICESCMNSGDEGDMFEDDRDDFDDEPDVDDLTEHQDFAHDDGPYYEDMGWDGGMEM